MYEGLVKRLRYCSEEQNGCGMCALSSDCVLRIGLLTQAANVIEEMTAIAESYKRSMEAWADEAANAQPRWISVMEQPPLKVGDDGYNGYLVYANGYYEVADYATDELDNVPYFHVDGEYEPDITHYMPLPEPPKEE